MIKPDKNSFLDFFNNFNSIMLLIDPHSGKIINANKTALNYYGYSLETLTNMSIHDINTLSKNQLQIEQQNVLKEKRNHFNFQHRLCNGEIRDVEVYSSAIEYNSENILLSIIYDISYRSKEISALQNDLDSTLAAIPDLMFELGLDGCYHSIRSTRTELMAAPPKEMLGKTIFDILPSKAANTCFEGLQEANQKGFSEGKEISLEINNTQKWFELSISRKSNTYTDGPHFIVLSRDITNRKNTLIEMRDSQARFKALHDATSDGIAIHDNGVILECNLMLTKLSGYKYNELINMNGLQLISEKSRSTAIENIQNSVEKPYEVFALHKSGTEFPVRIEPKEIIYKGKKTRVAVFNDITQERKVQEQLKRMAHYDALTNLPNRTLFADRLQQAIIQTKRRNTSLAVVYIDIDGFKEINDTYGHDIGDKLLVALSKKMQLALREEDTIARFGGDEFVATIVDLQKTNDCTISLKRILNATSCSIIIDGIQLQVSASLGVTIYPNDNEDTDILIRHADQAMYKAKQNGKNRYHIFNVDEDSAIRKENKFIEDIHSALEKEEFILYYQPKVNMKTGELIGVEALIRWDSPQKGLLNPVDFLPLIENHPISNKIGKWVIHNALKQIAYWEKEGLTIPISVNVGAKQLQNDFITQLNEILILYPDVTPELLEIEILETSFLEDISKVSKVIYTCNEMGIHFAIDDFGTGYSSLTYLKLLPAKLLKIDQSFIRDMIKDNNDLSIVKGIIALAKAFNLSIIAEGVESIEHGELLMSLGCELAQGYGIAKPMPANELNRWIKSWDKNKKWSKLHKD